MAVNPSKTYKPTGNWEVYDEYDPNWEKNAPVLVRPDGTIYAIFEPTELGRSESEGYKDTFNLNSDKSDHFGDCPYCVNGCPWCGR